MTEPPRPPGEGYPGSPSDPTSPPAPPGSYSTPGEAPAPGYPPPAYDQGGYPPPGGGGYPPQGGGYPPAGGGYYGGGPAPAGYANNDEKTWALVAHFGGAAGALVGGGAGGWIAPLVALLAKGNESPTVRAHAVNALNFQILWSIIAIVGYITMCIFIGFLITLAAWIIATVFGVIAGLKATNGELYNYPMSIKMIK
jgi:uncharacterized Tic20 family protein